MTHVLGNAKETSFRAVRIELLDEDRTTLSRASGVLVQEDREVFLYTCWHVVTGINFLTPELLAPPTRRKYLRFFTQDFQQRSPTIQAIGNSREWVIDLYRDDGTTPVWKQDQTKRDHADIECLGLRLPQFNDVVRIPVSLPSEFQEIFCFSLSDIWQYLSNEAADVALVGYPYGFSASGITQPTPIFLKRSVAAWMGTNRLLLDGGGAPGMSGCPVLCYHEARWWLMGIYSGIIFPDAQLQATNKQDTTMRLGVVYGLRLARGFMGFR